MVQSESVLLVQPNEPKSNGILYVVFRHVVCVFLLQILGEFITNSFKVVHEKEMRCIAFPAIGTGNLQMPPRFVAKVMIDELLKFSCKTPKTTLEDVRFILYFTNLPAMQASKVTSTKHLRCPFALET